MNAIVVLIALAGAPPAVDLASILPKRANGGAPGGQGDGLPELRARRTGRVGPIGRDNGRIVSAAIIGDALF
jgi:hypothetical protein